MANHTEIAFDVVAYRHSPEWVLAALKNEIAKLLEACNSGSVLVSLKHGGATELEKL